MGRALCRWSQEVVLVRGPRWNARRGAGWRTACGLVAVAVVVSLTVNTPGASADPKRDATRVSGPDLLGAGHGARDKDNRVGTAAPSARQRALAGRIGAVRWNALGTPSALGPQPGRGSVKALATGLPADPATAARQDLTQNRDLFGLDDTSAAAMDPLLVRPIGARSVALLRQ